MTEIYLIASNKRINRKEALAYRIYFEKTTLWQAELKSIFTLPFVYTLAPFDKQDFIKYLEHTFEVGNIVELYMAHNQNRLQHEINKMLENPANISINIAARLYRTKYEKLAAAEDAFFELLSTRTLIHPHGVTTIESYLELDKRGRKV